MGKRTLTGSASSKSLKLSKDSPGILTRMVMDSEYFARENAGVLWNA